MNARPPVELVVAAWDDPILSRLRAEARPRLDARMIGPVVVPRARSGADPYGGGDVPADAGLVYVVARRSDAPDGVVGCAGLRRLGDDTAEVERLYVRPAHRGQGISRLLLAGVEDLARRRGFTVVRLAATDLSTAGLYVSRGYVRIAPFGRLPSRDVCFEKSLVVTRYRPYR